LLDALPICDSELFTDLPGDVHVDLLIEFESAVALLADRYRGIFDALERSAKIKRNQATRNQLDVAAAEDPVEYRANKDFWCKAPTANCAFAIEGTGTRLPVVFQHRSLLVPVEFLERHHGWWPVRHIADAFANGIIERGVDFQFEVQSVGIHEEERGFVGRIRKRIAVPVGRCEGWARAGRIRPQRISRCVRRIGLLCEGSKGECKCYQPADAQSSQS